MDILLSNTRLHLIFEEVLSRLPKSIQAELNSFITTVKDIPEYELQGKVQKYLYGAYSEGGQNIYVYEKDCSTLSNASIAGVFAHELGHAYCHLKCNSPSLFNTNLDLGADLVASAWGFQEELDTFKQERKPSEDA